MTCIAQNVVRGEWTAKYHHHPVRTLNKSTPFCENSAAQINKPRPVKNSSFKNFLHLALAFSIATFIFSTLLFQSKNDVLKN